MAAGAVEVIEDGPSWSAQQSEKSKSGPVFAGGEQKGRCSEGDHCRSARGHLSNRHTSPTDAKRSAAEARKITPNGGTSRIRQPPGRDLPTSGASFPRIRSIWCAAFVIAARAVASFSQRRKILLGFWKPDDGILHARRSKSTMISASERPPPR